MSDELRIPGQGSIHIREARSRDTNGIIELIEGVFHEYEGCVLDLEGIDKELLNIKQACKDKGGLFWVAEIKDRIVGCVGYIQKENVVEIKRLYVAKPYRRYGLGSLLLDKVIFCALGHSVRAVDLWSDTRFKEAHSFYLRKGFEQLPQNRFLNDPSKSEEWRFMRLL